MTTVATLAGLMPLALGIGAGAELQRPLAIAVIGGLVTSTARDARSATRARYRRAQNESVENRNAMTCAFAPSGLITSAPSWAVAFR